MLNRRILVVISASLYFSPVLAAKKIPACVASDISLVHGSIEDIAALYRGPEEMLVASLKNRVAIARALEDGAPMTRAPLSTLLKPIFNHPLFAGLKPEQLITEFKSVAGEGAAYEAGNFEPRGRILSIDAVSPENHPIIVAAHEFLHAKFENMPYDERQAWLFNQVPEQTLIDLTVQNQSNRKQALQILLAMGETPNPASIEAYIRKNYRNANVKASSEFLEVIDEAIGQIHTRTMYKDFAVTMPEIRTENFEDIAQMTAFDYAVNLRDLLIRFYKYKPQIVDLVLASPAVREALAAN